HRRTPPYWVRRRTRTCQRAQRMHGRRSTLTPCRSVAGRAASRHSCGLDVGPGTSCTEVRSSTAVLGRTRRYLRAKYASAPVDVGMSSRYVALSAVAAASASTRAPSALGWMPSRLMYGPYGCAVVITATALNV